MAYKFNPLISIGLDDTGNDADAAAGGSDTQVQYNNGGALAGSADLTWDDSAKELGVGGDINLDDGGTYETTVQVVTPTANRTISFPDATGTVALVAGSNQAVQYNSAGANAGDSGLLYDATSGSLTVGGKTVTTSAPVINLSQTWNSAGTTFTGMKLNVTNTASASGSNLLDLQVGGSSRFKVSNAGGITFNNATVVRTDATSLVFSSSDGYQRVLAYSFGDTNATVRVGDAGVAGSVRLSLASGAELGWCSAAVVATPIDLALRRADAGVVQVTNGSTGTGYIKQVPVAVSALPSAATVGAGTRGFVNDANATTFADVVAGGGANIVPVYSDGTNWRIG
jgi:hypothetical protein